MPDNNTDDAAWSASTETPPTSSHTSKDHTAADRLHVDDPGELIVAVPAMVGFVPQRSLVVAVLRDAPNPGRSPIIDAVLRFDLETDGGSRRGLAAVYAQAVAQICAAEGASEVLAVIVDDRVRESRRTHRQGAVSTGPWAALIASFARRLAQQEVFVEGAWAVRAIEKDQRWWSLLEANRRGVLPDPAASMVTVAHVLDGRPIRGDRSELTDLVTPDHELVQQVTAHLDSAHALAHERYETAVRRGDPDEYHRRALENILWQIADTDSGGALTAPACAELAAALRDRTVRDSLFALAVGEHAAAAENLWAALTRALSGSDRADAATLLAYSAYIRGDGPLAGIALQAALYADPTHSMATLLETALHTGMRPDTLRRLAYSGLGIAADLGIDLDTDPTSGAAPDHTAL
ncbi:DUF4192 domain-containing protein [Nocardia anaemiae]|uniref:DUF4192 domain-containing protein n=1 Tax=Nocardia anaemiae TaxID=263910 RepID=UPI0007A44E47|nr:DUF4192 domain-containing protein [Nocardia anaemiae]